MFKGAAENSQNRARNAVVESRRNTGGIDASVFKTSIAPELNDRELLILRKLELQKKIAKIRTEMALATSRRRNNQGGQVNDITFQRMCAEFNNIKNEIMAIDERLLMFRASKRAAQKDRDQRTEKVFMGTAKDMLAEPIFKELWRETLRRLDQGAD